MASTNFSRPTRPSEGQAAQRATSTLSVVSERDEDLPTEPRFSWNVQHHVSRKHEDNEHEHDNRMRTRQVDVKDQRYSTTPNAISRSTSKHATPLPDSLTRDGYCNPTMPVPKDSPQPSLTRRDSGGGSTTSLPRSNLSRRDVNVSTANRQPSSSRNDSVMTISPMVPSRSNSTTRPPPSSRSNSSSTTSSTKQPFVPKSILKVTTVEQTSERSGSRSDSATGSNKSSDSNGSIPVSYDEDGKFVASEYDTSELSEKEIKKLQKKGINPALALEMKALRKGKSFGNLTGNAYV